MDAYLAGELNGLAFVIGLLFLLGTLALIWLLDRIWLMLDDRRDQRAHIEPTEWEQSEYRP